MPYIGENFIHLPNPQHPESEFRLRSNPKGEVNIVGTMDFGGGVKGRLGLLKESGKSAVFSYLFNKKKYTMEQAREWLKNHLGKEETMTDEMLSKTFDFTMLIQKDESGWKDDGFYHLALGVSSTSDDMQDDAMTDNGINEVVSEIKGKNLDNEHLKGLENIIGPITDSWLDENKMAWGDVRVRREWEKTIEDLVNSGVPMGGSIKGRATKVLPPDGTGVRKIDGVRIFKVALTDVPAAWDTRGTAQEVMDGCPGSMCTQIMKSLGIEDLKVKNVNQDDDELTKMITAVNQAGYNNVMKLIKTGKYDNDTAWKKPTLDDFKGDVKKYSMMCLGKDPGGDPKLAGTYGYPVGLPDGEVYRSGVAAASQAAGGAHTGTEQSDIQSAASKCLDEIKNKEEKSMTKKEGDKDESGLQKAVNLLKEVKGLLKQGKPEQVDYENATKAQLTEMCDGGDKKACQMLEKTVEKDDKDDDTMDREDILKRLDTLEQNEYKFEKTIKAKDDKIDELEKTVETLKDDKATQETDTLMNKALKDYRKLHPVEKGEPEAKEEDMMKDIATDFTEDELKEDFDGCVKSYSKSQEMAMKKIAKGAIPNTSDNDLQKNESKDKKIADKLEKQLQDQGKVASILEED